MSKRIGILTYFWSDNPGTFLQVCAMLQGLQARFAAHHVEVIDLRLERGGFRFSRADFNPVKLVAHIRRRRHRGRSAKRTPHGPR